MKEPQPNFHRVATNNARAARTSCWKQLNYKWRWQLCGASGVVNNAALLYYNCS